MTIEKWQGEKLFSTIWLAHLLAPATWTAFAGEGEIMVLRGAYQQVYVGGGQPRQQKRFITDIDRF